MTLENIIAQLLEHSHPDTMREHVESAFQAGVLHERERCKKMCEDMAFATYKLLDKRKNSLHHRSLKNFEEAFMLIAKKIIDKDEKFQ